MSCDIANKVSTKNIMMEYFKLQGKENMANAINEHCDEERGIVFNRHAATDEQKFCSIYDNSLTASEKISLSKLAATITPPYSSNDSVTSDSLAIIPIETFSERFSRTISKSFNNMSQRNNVFECEYTGKEEFLKKRSKQLSKVTILQEKTSSTENTTKQPQSVSERAVSDDSTDNICDVIVPEGKGKFQNFVGEDFVYILFRDGTRHYYPMHLVKYNRAYLKKNPLFTLNYNYKDKALKHTQNILKANKDSIWKVDKTKKTKTAISYEFIDFPEEANYLKKQLEINDETNINNNENYLIHLKTKQQNEKCNGLDERYMDDSTCNPIKKNIHVKNIKNLYQLQKISSYKILKEVVVDNNLANTVCCSVNQ